MEDLGATRNLRFTPPSAGEVEVTIFGRGYGEAILIHIGDAMWISVDSAEDRNGNPWALAYLKSISVHPSHIKYLFLSHWHTDHIRGAARILEASQEPLVIMPASGRSVEFHKFLACFGGTDGAPRSAPAYEMRRIAEYLTARKEQTGIRGLKMGISGLIIGSGKLDSGNYFRISTLSPSEEDLLCERRYFLDAIDNFERKNVQFHPSDKENHASCVVMIEINNLVILLGADREIHAGPENGWNTVMSSKTILGPTEPAEIFKVPHHGSETGYCPELWPNHIKNNSNIVIAPYINQKIPLPRPELIQKYLSHSSPIYITSAVNRARFLSTIVRSFGSIAPKIQSELDIREGFVRFRTHMQNANRVWTVELFDGAYGIEKTS